jgi:hypothetical protein
MEIVSSVGMVASSCSLEKGAWKGVFLLNASYYRALIGSEH